MTNRFEPPATEENVGCNLIPMIDIMFLLLLFFMLGADMTQRELAEVVLPKADNCKEDDANKPGSGERTTVNVFHRVPDNTFTCATFQSGGICREPEHWLMVIRGEPYTRETLKTRLRAEAAREPPEGPPPGPNLPPISGRKVMIRADHLTPFGTVQRVIEACAGAGIYKIEVGAARPSPVQ